MPLAPPIAMSQGATSYHLLLTMDGYDLIHNPGTAPSVGVPLDSIVLTEAGPGGVSNLRFTIEDPGTSSPLPGRGSVVRVQDLVHDVPLFRGTVVTWGILPDGVGRRIQVECDGPEAVLDSVVPPLQGKSSENLQSTIHRWASQNLRVDNYALGTTPEGTRATPIGQLGLGVALPYAEYLLGSLGNTTFRQAIEVVARNALVHPISGVAYHLPSPNMTVDMYGGLRVWDIGAQPDDYTTLTITDTAAGAQASVAIRYELHPGDVVHEVLVEPDISLPMTWVADGTGIVGKQAYLKDLLLDTATKVQQAGVAYLADQAELVRGSFRLDPFDPATTIHAGSLVSITDASLGLSAQTYIIQTIVKRFPSGQIQKQSWEVHFGGRRPSVVQELRNLNRAIVN